MKPLRVRQPEPYARLTPDGVLHAEGREAPHVLQHHCGIDLALERAAERRGEADADVHARPARQRRASRIMLNRVPPASRLRTLIEAEIAGRRLPCLRAALGNRTGFALAFAEGLSVAEYAPRSVAAAELRALTEEVQELTA